MKEISKITVYVSLEAPEKWDSFYNGKNRAIRPYIGELNELCIYENNYIIATYSTGTWKKILLEYSYSE